MLNPLRFAVDTVRAVVAIPRIIVRLPAMVENLDRLATEIIPALVAGAEPLARASSPIGGAVSRDRSSRARRDVPSGTRQPEV